MTRRDQFKTFLLMKGSPRKKSLVYGPLLREPLAIQDDMVTAKN
jgi:hypothetical protein